ncbi:hypothetical protein [Streptomyces sp. A1547]|uniref:Helix-turn-helix DNA binding domain protein n=1 Tax=Streptomyces sp. R33 TaxID=3238629 RepID=A0AB39Y4S7_9ACTN|nr:hypothetical protein [Streptomyces sp. A1547]THA38560.1 hypothetical protein E6W17_16305 [Streptomyces sp. A1547]
MRATSDPLTDAENTELDEALQAVRRAEQALVRAQAHLNRTAGRIGSADRYGQKAAVGRRVGWSRQHVTTLANAYRAGELDQEESEAA